MNTYIDMYIYICVFLFVGVGTSPYTLIDCTGLLWVFLGSGTEKKSRLHFNPRPLSPSRPNEPSCLRPFFLPVSIDFSGIMTSIRPSH